MSDETIVKEDKFNGTASMVVEKAEDKDEAKAYARRFWKENYGTKPTRIVAERDESFPNLERWTVMIADHSSGSLKKPKVYTE